MSIPVVGDGIELGNGNALEPVKVGSLQPSVFGNATDTTGFFGVTGAARPSGSAQAALTLTTATAAGVGFTSATAFNAAIGLLVEVRAALVSLNLIKGSA